MDSKMLIEQFDRRVQRREERRRFLKAAGSTVAVVGGAAVLSGCFDSDNNDDGQPLPNPTPTPPPPSGGVTDPDILNFALNLEYLEAQFYSYAVSGAGLPAGQLTGTGTQGGVTGGRQVPFSDPVVAQYAREIARDEEQHVAFLRRALGAAAVAQPAIDISSAPDGAFSSAARAAGLIGAGQSFDPYANDENFLLGAFIFEDVGVSAYKGAAPLVNNRAFRDAAAGILGAEAYHAGLVRTVLYAKGIQTPTLRTATDRISDARDSLDGPTDLDQGVTGTADTSNIVPTDADGIVFSRTTGQVLNIVFLTRMAAMRGGFFPNGVNGAIMTSANNG
jgi:hypothetical protein